MSQHPTKEVNSDAAFSDDGSGCRGSHTAGADDSGHYKGGTGEEYSGYMAASILASLAVFWSLLYIIIIIH